MGTRAQVGIEGSSVTIYKHNDGYPDEVLEWLLPFRDRFFAGRGYDPEYFLAQLLRHTGAAGPDAVSATHPSDFLSWGVCEVLHSDIEFFYYVRKNGDVEVYEVKVGWRAERQSIEKLTGCWPLVAIVQRGAGVDAYNLQRLARQR